MTFHHTVSDREIQFLLGLIQFMPPEINGMGDRVGRCKSLNGCFVHLAFQPWFRLSRKVVKVGVRRCSVDASVPQTIHDGTTASVLLQNVPIAMIQHGPAIAIDPMLNLVAECDGNILPVVLHPVVEQTLIAYFTMPIPFRVAPAFAEFNLVKRSPNIVASLEHMPPSMGAIELQLSRHRCCFIEAPFDDCLQLGMELLAGTQHEEPRVGRFDLPAQNEILAQHGLLLRRDGGRIRI
mmetsp:Transcript_2882/g.8095  ORF Transcript_2882/g.8095 Transcript_2882/m.8095 type:complete len:237 (-) Transcript_2882:824-1534(-)